MRHHHHSGSQHIDSIDIGGGSSHKSFGEWLVYHSFVTDSRVPVNACNQSGLVSKIEVLDSPSHKSCDYGNFTNEVYGRNPRDASLIESKSYGDLYNQYIVLDTEKRKLITSYLMDLNGGERPGQWFSDSTYWQITKNHAIVEKILGRQEYCDKKVDCSKCGMKQRQHHSMSANDWLASRLAKIMGDSPWCDSYLEIIKTCRNEIRHGVVHESETPSAKDADRGVSGKNEMVRYPLDKMLKGFRGDKNALMALGIALESVTWYLLMDYIFKHKVFAEPTGFSVIYLTLRQPKEL